MPPIFEALVRGEKFPFSLLASEYEDTRQYWDWWWRNGASESALLRPEIIADDDPILTPTVGLATFSESNHAFLLAGYRQDWKDQGVIRRSKCGDNRTVLHEDIVSALAGQGERRSPPFAVFTGGGYGSGKTSIAHATIRKTGRIPLSINATLGVDRCKQLVPEFSYISRISDGRASMTVQAECIAISEKLFDELVERRLSFVWDSSLSDKEKSFDKIRRCREARYDIDMIGSVVDRATAIRRAVRRARDIRRFAHPLALPKSHIGFLSHFEELAAEFDEAFVFDNSIDCDIEEAGTMKEPVLLAQKLLTQNALDVFDRQNLENIRETWLK